MSKTFYCEQNAIFIRGRTLVYVHKKKKIMNFFNLIDRRDWNTNEKTFFVSCIKTEIKFELLEVVIRKNDGPLLLSPQLT